MRVIAGKFKGRRLATVRGDIRPTSDRLRESLFDVLGDRVPGSVWLDLFAGTGAIGIEALSRGASKVVFNDREPSAAALVAKNLDLCGLARGIELLRLDAFKLISTARMDPAADFVFMDPPYAFGRHYKLLDRISRSRLIHPGSCLILETGKALPTGFLPDNLCLSRTVEAGDSRLYLIEPGTPLPMDDGTTSPEA